MHIFTIYFLCQYYGQINGNLSRLWTALTMGKDMPLSTDDLINDFFKPTRKEFKDFVNDLGGGEKIKLYEWLSFVNQAIEDRMKVFD